MTVRTGKTEPKWPTKPGAKVIEYSELESVAVAVAPPVATPPTLPPEIEKRYFGDPLRGIA